jgi:hypothetical protein
MQPPTDGPRAGFTTAQVRYLVEQASSFDTTMGMQLLDQGLNVVADVSDGLEAVSVSRDSFANIHASMTFTIDQPLDWGNAIVRPYMTFTGPLSATGPQGSLTFYLGVFVTDTPQEDLSEDVSSFGATGYDLISLLDDPVGDAYSIDAGEFPLEQVEEILISRGFSQYIIDQGQAGATLASAKTYTVDDNVTWLTIVNDLLGTVGYQGIWSDWNGVLRAQVYDTPSDRSPEWLMSDDPAVTLLTQRRKRQRDFYSTPNHWIFYRNTSTEGDQPSDDNGFRYEYTNQSDGDTSVDARGGRQITKVVGVDASDNLAVVQQAQQTIDADMLVPTVISIETAPFPMAWHMDRIQVSDAGLGVALQVLASSWALNLDGSDMSWSWTVVS